METPMEIFKIEELERDLRNFEDDNNDKQGGQ